MESLKKKIQRIAKENMRRAKKEQEMCVTN